MLLKLTRLTATHKGMGYGVHRCSVSQLRVPEVGPLLGLRIA